MTFYEYSYNLPVSLRPSSHFYDLVQHTLVVRGGILTLGMCRERRAQGKIAVEKEDVAVEPRTCLRVIVCSLRLIWTVLYLVRHFLHPWATPTSASTAEPLCTLVLPAGTKKGVQKLRSKVGWKYSKTVDCDYP